jgi:plasmid stabilization system protein ParE
MRLIEATERLKEFPLSGRIIPEIKDPLCREIIYKNYRIMYQIHAKNVWITGVIHGARNW